MVTGFLDLNTSQLNDLIFEVHWLLRKFQFELSSFIVNKVQSFGLWLKILTKKNQIDLFSWLSRSEVGPPGNELK